MTPVAAYLVVSVIITVYAEISARIHKAPATVFLVCAIIPLVPGVALTCGARDVCDGEYISGSVRLIDAVLGFFCVAAGVGAVIAVYHLLGGAAL